MTSPQQCAKERCQEKATFQIFFNPRAMPDQVATAYVCDQHSRDWPRAAGTSLRRRALPTVDNVGGQRCDIRPCAGTAHWIVTFEKQINVKHKISGSAQVCRRHENEWPSANWGKKLSSRQIRNVGTGKAGVKAPKLPKIPRQKPGNT